MVAAKPDTLRCCVCDESLSWGRVRTMVQIIRPAVDDDKQVTVRAICLLCFMDEHTEEYRRRRPVGAKR